MIGYFFITKNIPILEESSNFNIVGIEKFIGIIIEWLKKILFLREKNLNLQNKKDSLLILKKDNLNLIISKFESVFLLNSKFIIIFTTDL